MEDVIRVGLISTVDKEHGTAQVYYPDRGSVTGQLHLFAFRAEFNPPEVGDQVVVVHLSNDTSTGVILGRFWGDADPPPSVDYQKEMAPGISGRVQGAVYTLTAPEIILSGSAGSMSLSELVSLRQRVERLEADDG
ncbi:phage baseplate assembly protein V [Enterocloster aldenensis]|uniref:phage baseplate assembly protein V n=1 Tax=Enterocloster aldenensis TaxID=358742 RepID=UPI0025A32F87|nr:phage baseplate assembly protein V [Enterocloster aldenensis]